MNTKLALLASAILLAAWTDGQRIWNSPERLNTGAETNTIGHHIAADGQGNVIAVWDQAQGTTSTILATRFRAGGAIPAPLRLEAGDSLQAVNPSIAVNSSGSAVVLWARSSWTVASASFDPARGWSAAEILGEGTTGWTHHVAVGASGDAMALWSDRQGRLWTRRRPLDGTWGAVEAIPAPPALAVASPRVAMDAHGRSIAVWRLDSATLPSRIFASRHSLRAGWEAARPLQDAVVDDALDPQLDIDAAGNAIAVWWDFEGQFKAWSRRFDVTNGWGVVEALQEDDPFGPSFAPNIRMTAKGDAIATWTGAGALSVRARHYLAGSGWGPTTILQTEAAEFGPGSPAVALDPRGNALAFWQQNNPGPSAALWVAEYSAGSGWGRAKSISSSIGSTYQGDVTLDSTGGAVVSWIQTPASPLTYSFWIARSRPRLIAGPIEELEAAGAGFQVPTGAKVSIEYLAQPE